MKRRDFMKRVGVFGAAPVALHKSLTSISDTPSPKRKTKIIGHRGAAGEKPQNTKEAFNHAFEAGVDGVEIDVRSTIDNELIVLHDPVLDRKTTGSGLAEEKTLEEIKSVTRHNGEKILTFREFLEEYGHRDTLFIIEIKSDGIVEDCATLCDEYGITDRTVFASFDVKHLTKVPDTFETAMLGYFPTPLATDTKTTENGFTYSIPHYGPEVTTKHASQKKPKPGVWELLSAEPNIKECVDANPVIYITNNPKEAVEYRDAKP